MLLIFGMRIRLTTIDEGEFFCPHCGGDRHYLRRRIRRWFTLFFLPMIPLKVLGELIECTSCHSRYEESVLLAPTSAALSTMLDGAVRVTTAAMVQAGDPTDPKLRDAAVTSVRAAGVSYDDATLVSDVAVVDRSQIPDYLAPLADGLEVSGKERFIADLVRVAWAGGVLTPDQRAVIDSAGRSLGLTPAHVAGVVATTSQATSTPPPPLPPNEPNEPNPS